MLDDIDNLIELSQHLNKSTPTFQKYKKYEVLQEEQDQGVNND